MRASSHLMNPTSHGTCVQRQVTWQVYPEETAFRKWRST